MPILRESLFKEEYLGLIKDSEKDWLGIVKNQFEHPAIVLWRAVELRHIEKILKDVFLDEPILDLGCAEGKIANLLFKDRKIFGLDNCWELLSQNNKLKLYKAVTLADACHIPYKDNAFATIFSNCVIEHILDLDSLLKEVSRTLKQRGVFLFTVPSHKFADFLFFSIVFEKLGLNRLSQWYKLKRNQLLNHFHCYDHQTWRDKLEEKNLKVISYSYYMPKKATMLWDVLAAAIFISQKLGITKIIKPVVTLFFKRQIKRYYLADDAKGAALFLIARKV